MKTTASISTSAFFSPAFRASRPWGETRQRTVRRVSTTPQRFALDTDDLAATKQEVVCGGILALCFLYTLGHMVAQLAF